MLVAATVTRATLDEKHPDVANTIPNSSESVAPVVESRSTTAHAPSEESAPLVMQIVVRRDLMDVRVCLLFCGIYGLTLHEFRRRDGE